MRWLVGLLVGLAALGATWAAPARAQGTARHEVVIVGGGMAGLSAAWFLQDRDVLVLERRAQVGGRARTGQADGLAYPLGPTHINQADEVLVGLGDELGLEPWEVTSPLRAVAWRGGFWYGDQGIAGLAVRQDGLEVFNGFINAIQGLGEDYEDPLLYDPDSPMRALDAMPARAWLNQLGLRGFMLGDYQNRARSLFGCGLGFISAMGLVPEVSRVYEGWPPVADPEELVNTPAQGREVTGCLAYGPGMSEMVGALARALAGKVKTSHTVTKVIRSGDGYEVVYQPAQGPKAALRAKAVILAVPAPVARRLAGPVLGPARDQLLASVRYGAAVNVALRSDAPLWDRSFSLSLPGQGLVVELHDATWLPRHHDRWPAGAPNVAVAHLASRRDWRDKSLLDLPDAELVRVVLAELAQTLPAERGQISGHAVARWPYAHPVPEPGSHGRMHQLCTLNTGGLLLADDYLTHPGLGGAAEAGRQAAEAARLHLRR